MDNYPAHCGRAGNDRFWVAPRDWPQLQLPSEAAGGVDGEWALPFAVRVMTRPPVPVDLQPGRR